MRSSYIEWLVEQKYRMDDIGLLSRWVLDEMNVGFTPIEFDDVLSRIRDNAERSRKFFLNSTAYESLVEFATDIPIESISIIDDSDVLEQRLENAVNNEEYEKAAEIRDEINKNKSGDGHEQTQTT
jgi:hypothetical protein